MDRERARTLLREFARQGCVAISRHCRQRMVESGVTMDDVLYVMIWGEVRKIEKDCKAGYCKCTVEGPDIEGQDMILKLALDEHRYSVVCITVY